MASGHGQVTVGGQVHCQSALHSQRVHECRIGLGVGQGRADVTDGLLNRDAPVPGSVHGRDCGCTALRLHAVEQDGAALTAKHGNGVGSLLEQVVEMGIGATVRTVDEPYLDVIAVSDAGRSSRAGRLAQ